MWVDQNWTNYSIDIITKYTKKITLKIIKFDDKDCWYFDKIGNKFNFWKIIFKDDQGFESLWLVQTKTNIYYVHIYDTNYIKYTRLLKLRKLNKHK